MATNNLTASIQRGKPECYHAICQYSADSCSNCDYSGDCHLHFLTQMFIRGGKNPMTYKVLDVREKESKYSYTDYNNTYTAAHTVFVVIAEDTLGKRKRFTMYDGYKSLFLNEWSYYGYEGDFDLLVKDDWFEIEQTSTWPVVKILGVSDEEDVK